MSENNSLDGNSLFNDSTKTNSNKELDNDQSSMLARFASFAVFRYTANIEWVGGVAGGKAVIENLGTNQWLTAGAVAIGVGMLEYSQTALAKSRIKSSQNNTGDSDESLKTKVAKEATVGWSALWQGASATVTVNDSVGVESTKKRRMLQSAMYGLAVGIWVTPVPGFKQAADSGTEIVSAAIENPIKSSLIGVLSTGAIFGGLELFKNFREKRQNKKQ
jgi:hypothetical protein